MSEPINSRETKLLKFLVQNQLLSAEVAEAAEIELRSQKGDVSVLEFLGRRGLIEEEQLAVALAHRMRLAYVNLATCTLDPDTVTLIREDLATKYRVVALRQEDQTLIVATANPWDHEASRAIEFATQRRVRLVVATASAVLDALGRAYHFDAALNAYLQGAPGDNDVPIAQLEDETADLATLKRQTSLPPVVKLLNLVLLDGIRSGASDIHIEPTAHEIRVRYRIDGMLQESYQFPKWVHDPLVARCKVLSKLDITERAKPQDGRIRIQYQNALVDLRVSSLPTQFGEKVTLRILNAATAPAGLDHLGLPERDLRCLRQAISRPQGMVLVTGPTGSGKTTTLYSMLAELISPTRNIVTIENPIEYQIKGVNQVEINDRRGLTFAGTLRSILRQDPDVILVGEIRDQETAQIAVRAAQTGHLVLSTLHTNDSVATIARLVDLGIEPYILGSSLNLIVAQRLSRRVCHRCSEPYTPDPETLNTLHLQPSEKFRRGRGCGSCHNSGFAGRAAVLEVMAITPALMRLVETKAADSVIRQQALDDGMTPLGRAAISKVLDGITTPEEIIRAVDVFDQDSRCPSCDRVVDDKFTICPHCTTPLRLCCNSCGNQLQPEWQMCPYCRTPAPYAGQAAAPKTSVGSTRQGALPGAAPRAESAAGRSFKILVVDDEPDFRRLLTVFLQQSGLPVSVTTAVNGAQALQAAESDTPDLILLDIMMPEMDGFDVCARLRANVRTTFIPILMLTALNDPVSRTRGFLVGTDDFIGKPFDRAELLARVRRVLQRTYGLAVDQDAIESDAPPLALAQPEALLAPPDSFTH
jgi:type IV pilus assembly protein PilB